MSLKLDLPQCLPHGFDNRSFLLLISKSVYKVLGFNITFLDMCVIVLCSILSALHNCSPYVSCPALAGPLVHSDNPRL